MLNKIDQELLEIKMKLKDQENYEHKLKNVLYEIKGYEQKKIKLLPQLSKEKKDVDKLEKLTLKSIWYSLLGSKTLKLNKEKAELSKVEYEYKFINETIKRLIAESEYYQDKIAGSKQLEAEYQKLINEKEQLISDSNHELSQPLSQINQERVEVESSIKEINEAINAGTEVMDALSSIIKVLNKAKGWGTLDLFGGGLLSNMIKHSHLDDADSQLSQLKYLINKYTRELKDVNMQLSIDLDISNMLKFMDFFFDNFFSDFMVQSRIEKTFQQAREAYYKVQQQLDELRVQHRNQKTKIKTLTDNKNKLLSPN
jgi:hypothetical protein